MESNRLSASIRFNKEAVDFIAQSDYTKSVLKDGLMMFDDRIEQANLFLRRAYCREGTMIEKVVRKGDLREFSESRKNLDDWLSKTPEERVAAVEQLRRQYHGGSARLQRTARVVQRSAN